VEERFRTHLLPSAGESFGRDCLDPIGLLQRARTLRRPEDVIEVVLFRFAFANDEEIAQLSQCVTPGHPRDKFKAESSFVGLAGVLDEASKRVLPKHTRAALVSRVCISQTRCQFGLLVEGLSGEVGTFDFVVERAASRWVLGSVTRDTHEDEQPLEEPTPRAAPEVVVLTQLQALQDHDVRAAFRHNAPGVDVEVPNMSRAGLSTNAVSLGSLALHTQDPSNSEARTHGQGIHLQRFAALMWSPCYELLLGNTAARVTFVRFKARPLTECMLETLVTKERPDPECKDGSSMLVESAYFAWTLRLTEDRTWRLHQLRRLTQSTMEAVA